MKARNEIPSILQHFGSSRLGFFKDFEAQELLLQAVPLAFLYHYNRLEASNAIDVAILDSGLGCTAPFPCPAETGGPVHIHGTASSIVDSVIVCGATGHRLFTSPGEPAGIVAEYVDQLAFAGMMPTSDEPRCILVRPARMAVWKLRRDWGRDLPTSLKIAALADAVSEIRKSRAGPRGSSVDPLARDLARAGRKGRVP